MFEKIKQTIERVNRCECRRPYNKLHYCEVCRKFSPLQMLLQGEDTLRSAYYNEKYKDRHQKSLNQAEWNEKVFAAKWALSHKEMTKDLLIAEHGEDLVNQAIRELKDEANFRACFDSIPFSISEGRVQLSEQDARKGIKAYVSFRKLLKAIAYAYMEDVLDLYDAFNDVQIAIINIDKSTVTILYEIFHEDRYSEKVPYKRGTFDFPVSLIWSDWQKFCKDAAAKRKEEHEKERDLLIEEHAKKEEKYRQNQIVWAKKILEEYDGK